MAHVGAGMNHDYVDIYRTVDGGQTWQLMVDPTSDTSGIMSCQKNNLFFTDLANGWLTGTCNGVAAGVLLFHTVDGGASWSQVSLPDPEGQTGIYTNFDAICGSQFPGLVNGVFSLEVTCKLMSSGLQQPMAWLYSTLDEGANWSIRSVSAGSLSYLPGGGVFIQADPVRMIDTSGVSVEFPHTPAGREAQFISDQDGWMLSEDGSVLYHTTDGGKSWEEIAPVVE